MTSPEIQMMIHQRVLDMRSLEHFVNTRKFEIAYDSAEDVDKTIIEDSVRLADNAQSIEHLKDFINHLLRKELQEKSVRELRDIAANLQIPGYNKLSKLQLISTIKGYEHEKGRSESTSTIHDRTMGRNPKKNKGIVDYSV